jgi:hypothetical protein
VAKLWASAMNLSAGTKQKNSAIAKLIRNQPAKKITGKFRFSAGNAYCPGSLFSWKNRKYIPP